MADDLLSIPASVPDDYVMHVTPRGDLKEHLCDRMECWCSPRLVESESGYVVVHNSMDGREKFETGERKLS